MRPTSVDVRPVERDTRAIVGDPAFVTRIRLRARRYVLWLRHLWSGSPGGLGISIANEEIDRILTSRDELAPAELAFYEADATARELTLEICAIDRAAAAEPFLVRLRSDFGLSAAELDLLTLTVAVESDPWLRRMCGYIHDEATATLPTPWLASQLFQWDLGTQIGPHSSLVRWRLAHPLEPQPTPWSVTAGWVADPFVIACMTSAVLIDSRLGHAVEIVAGPPASVRECLYPAELAAMIAFAGALSGPIDIVIVGATGAGKRTLGSQLAAQLQIPMLIVNAASLLGPAVDPTVARELRVRVLRQARLLGAAIYWDASDGVVPGSLRDTSPPALSIYATRDASVPGLDAGTPMRQVRIPALSQTARVDLWSSLSSRPVPPAVLDWPLAPADIVRAAAVAGAGVEAVIDACRANLRVDAVSLATSLPRPYEWKDLVLSPTVSSHLRELDTQARLRWPVYEEWGFGRLCPMGRGIAALFAGPSGTGKTMAAQVLARSLGMELYRVDLAGVMSKYIGETEKNLRQVFDACERANVVLFFDEADALFGQRMAVKDAHDRFANIEIDYLLQRMEQFDGIAILATNRKTEIDGAFLRRIRFVIDFLQPGVPERRELWTRALPSRAPNGDELLDRLDWDLLATRLNMTGADIKNAAISAAFLARSEGARIGMPHVLRAARRELAKHGVTVRAGDLEA